MISIKFAPWNVPLRRRIQTFALLCHFLEMHFMFALEIYVFGFLTFTIFSIIPLLYLAFYIYDKDTPVKGGRRIKWLRNCRLSKYIIEYFPLKMVKTSELDANQNYIFGCHPHGIISLNAVFNFSYETSDFTKLFPNLMSHLITLHQHFWFPFHREFLMGLGMCSANKESIEYILKNKGKGNAVVIVVGGAAEALEAHPKRAKIYLSKRKGFIKLAIQNGAHLVPCYQFGENELYNQLVFKEGSYLRKIQEKITKIFKVSPPLFLGRGIFQYSFGLLPFRKPLTTVIGSAIPVEKVENPTEKQIDELHEKYIKSLQKLYKGYNPIYGDEKVKFEIY